MAIAEAMKILTIGERNDNFKSRKYAISAQVAEAKTNLIEKGNISEDRPIPLRFTNSIRITVTNPIEIRSARAKALIPKRR